MTTSKRLWILTEERPKRKVIGEILTRFVETQGIAAFFDTIRIIPVLTDEANFSSTYRVLGFSSPAISDVLLKLVSGNSSFVDYLIYFQEEEPTATQQPSLLLRRQRRTMLKAEILASFKELRSSFTSTSITQASSLSCSTTFKLSRRRRQLTQMSLELGVSRHWELSSREKLKTRELLQHLAPLMS